MDKMTHRFFIFFLSLFLVACGGSALRGGERAVAERGVVCPFAVESARDRVLSHLHYSVDVHTVDYKRGTVELSFYFSKEQGDSVLWVECVERVPLTLIDTVLCRRWFDYYYHR